MKIHCLQLLKEKEKNTWISIESQRPISIDMGIIFSGQKSGQTQTPVSLRLTLLARDSQGVWEAARPFQLPSSSSYPWCRIAHRHSNPSTHFPPVPWPFAGLLHLPDIVYRCKLSYLNQNCSTWSTSCQLLPLRSKKPWAELPHHTSRRAWLTNPLAVNHQLQ